MQILLKTEYLKIILQFSIIGKNRYIAGLVQIPVFIISWRTLDKIKFPKSEGFSIIYKIGVIIVLPNLWSYYNDEMKWHI